MGSVEAGGVAAVELCKGCLDATFALAEERRRGIEAFRLTLRSGAVRPRPGVNRPPALKVVEPSRGPVEVGYRQAFVAEEGPLIIRRRWATLTTAMAFPVCAFWDYLMIFGRVLIFVHPLVGLPCLCISAYLTYTVLAYLVNRTEITVTARELSVHHGPLPWSRDITLRCADIVQLYCEEAAPIPYSDTKRNFHVSAVLRDLSRVRLVPHLPEADQALFIEQRIEEHLGIPDAGVAGELRR